MEIRWFRNRYREFVYLYRNGKDLYGEIIFKYVERIEFLKDDIGKGKVIFRIFKLIVDDDGLYYCVFKVGEFYEEYIIEIKVIGRYGFFLDFCVFKVYLGLIDWISFSV